MKAWGKQKARFYFQLSAGILEAGKAETRNQPQNSKSSPLSTILQPYHPHRLKKNFN